jgi:hypothetical protein
MGPARFIPRATEQHQNQAEPLAELQRQHPRLYIGYFPSCAPEFNPNEGVWA